MKTPPKKQGDASKVLGVLMNPRKRGPNVGGPTGKRPQKIVAGVTRRPVRPASPLAGTRADPNLVPVRRKLPPGKG